MGGWTKIREAWLVQCWTVEGMTMNQIAIDMRLSRGTIAGKLARMGLMGNYDRERARQQWRDTHKPAPRPQPFPKPRPRPLPRLVPIHHRKPKTMPTQPQYKFTHLFDLAPEDCRFIVTDEKPLLYCGVPVPDTDETRGPYCPYHSWVMTNGSKNADADLQATERETGAVSDDDQQDRAGQRGPDPLGLAARS